MDLELLKSAVHSASIDAENENNEEREKVKKEISNGITVLYKVMDVFYEGWSKKMKETVESLLSYIISILKKNEFIVTREEKTEEVPDGTVLIAKYEGAKIEIGEINYNGKPMSFGSSISENARFYIGTPKSVPNYYLFREHVDICGTKLCKLSSEPKEVYEYFVKEDTCLDELYVIKQEIAGDIAKYRRGIENLDTVTLSIYNQTKDSVYKDFDTFWEEL